jgi:hypothetical protein
MSPRRTSAWSDLRKYRLVVGVLVLSAAALAAAGAWGLWPLGALNGLAEPSWTPIDLIAHRVPHRLVDPGLIVGAKDNLDFEVRWAVAETRARMAVIVAVWLAAVTLFVRKVRRR